MTKETKVGLLVGLAFVIVIGIYLSDHASNTSQAPQAPLQLAGTSALRSIGDNGIDDSGPVVKIPSNVAPRTRVPTKRDLTPQRRQPGVRLVDPLKTVTPSGTDDGRAELERQAANMGEPLVPVDPNGQILPPTPVQPKPPMGTRSYVAQAGDSLGTIARKAYGSSSQSYRRAIMAANPFMGGNQDMIVAGRTYAIPAVASSGTPAAEQPPVDPSTPATSAAVTIYTVQPGDSLWSIAKTQVGSSAAVSTIMELNKDVLHGSSTVRESMKLRLPKKSS